ncbi:MAG TPA: HAMP domain-containing protein [Desulfobulbus sp.]|nr:HAMP domain-containing protein [Desulfobulbus sp.]
MLVICEDCAKKYNIDEMKIKGDSARFSCQECGHIIVVKKPSGNASSTKENPVVEEGPVKSNSAGGGGRETNQAPLTRASAATTTSGGGKGWPISAYLLLTLVTGFFVISGTFSYLYLKYIPEIINQQIELRTIAISKSFAGVIQKPLLVRNYLQVNKEAQRTSALPGVAYAAVTNKRGIVIAGFFSDLNKFDRQFVMQVKKKGFPKSVIKANALPAGMKEKSKQISVGGQIVFDHVIALPNKEGEVHVAVYVSEIDDAIRNVLLSPLTLSLVGGVLFVGFVIFLLLTRSITKPTRQLTDMANRISLGEMDLTITPRGPREMRELAVAFERMRYSVKAAMDRLKK